MEKIEPKTVERPWGGFEEFCENTECTVKILTVNEGEALSLQKHRRRAEFWKILSGSAKVLIGGEEAEAKEGDEFNIPPETEHRITAATKTRVLEISLGEFDEGDEVRLEDKYGRAEK